MSKLFSLEGKGLKLTTAEDIEPHIQALKENNDVEEVRFLGNTLGIEACEALAKVLETKKSLKVRLYPPRYQQTMDVTDTRPGRKLRRHLHRPPAL
jgi:Ran GTPase-activating protein (RanGAP) involved in mRNA processing and transport